MPTLASLLELRAFDIGEVSCLDEQVVLVPSPQGPTARCPLCRRPSPRIQSRYGRQVTDLPCAGRTVKLLIQARRFVCQAGRCPRKLFCERLEV